jgi:general secretion pathway protein G
MVATLLERARKAREDESGFTLIELLIVIVILGILAGIVVFSVGGVTDTGKASACKADAKTVEVAAEAFRAQKGWYPGDTTNDATVLTSAQAQTELQTAGFLRDVPNSTDYTVTLAPNTGKVTATGSCTVS